MKEKNLLLIIVVIISLISLSGLSGCEQFVKDKPTKSEPAMPTKPKPKKATPPRTVKISVNQYVHHPNLEKTYKGFQDVLGEWAKRKNVKIKYDLQNANGDVSVTTQIAQQQILKKPDLILALATPSAQACAKATTEIPIVFGAITDPVSAGLVDSMEAPGRNLAGSSEKGSYFHKHRNS